MGFKIIPDDNPPPITINDLTPDMIFELINCYALDYDPSDVECRVPAHDGVVPMNYPIINKEVVKEFYEQLDIFTTVVRDVIIGNYHTGLVVDPNSFLWKWGTTPATPEDLKYWVFFVIKRDFNEQGTWLYTLTEGDVSALQSFIYSAVDLFLQANDHGDYNLVVSKIKAAYPFTQT